MARAPKTKPAGAPTKAKRRRLSSKTTRALTRASWSDLTLSPEAFDRILAAAEPARLVSPDATAELQARLAKIAWEYLRIKSHTGDATPSEAAKYFDRIVRTADALIAAICGPDWRGGVRRIPWNKAPWQAVDVPDRPAENVDDFAQIIWWREAADRGGDIARADVGRRVAHRGDIPFRVLVGELGATWQSCFGRQPALTQRPDTNEPAGPFFRFCQAAIAELNRLDDRVEAIDTDVGKLARAIKDTRTAKG
jgi:hypothetical protein